MWYLYVPKKNSSIIKIDERNILIQMKQVQKQSSGYTRYNCYVAMVRRKGNVICKRRMRFTPNKKQSADTLPKPTGNLLDFDRCHWDNVLSTDDAFSPSKTSYAWLLHLPEELLVHLIRFLDIRSVLSLKQAHSMFYQLVHNNLSVLAEVGFTEEWPTWQNLHHFEEASEHGNFTATCKLGMAYMYNEGIHNCENCSCCVHGVKRSVDKAAAYFCHMESLESHTIPFSWMFYRNPWQSDATCQKKAVFYAVIEHVKVSRNAGSKFISIL